MGKFIQIPISNLYRLSDLKHRVQCGVLRICCTYNGEVIGFFLPVFDRNQLASVENLKEEEIPFSKFRKLLPESIQIMMESLDILNLTFHGRTTILFVSGQLKNHIELPLLGNPDLLIRGA